MKRTTLFGLAAIIAFFLTSCQKDIAPTQKINATILGKWNILNDSTFSGVGINHHAVNYTGRTGDYFDCRKDGNIYIKEGIRLDTLSYNLTSDTTILIVPFGIILNGTPEMSHITNLTAHNSTISARIVLTPAGIFGRKVNLNR